MTLPTSAASLSTKADCCWTRSLMTRTSMGVGLSSEVPRPLGRGKPPYNYPGGLDISRARRAPARSAGEAGVVEQVAEIFQGAPRAATERAAHLLEPADHVVQPADEDRSFLGGELDVVDFRLRPQLGRQTRQDVLPGGSRVVGRQVDGVEGRQRGRGGSGRRDVVCHGALLSGIRRETRSGLVGVGK